MATFLGKEHYFFSENWPLAIYLKHKNKVWPAICKFEISATKMKKRITNQYHLVQICSLFWEVL